MQFWGKATLPRVSTLGWHTKFVTTHWQPGDRSIGLSVTSWCAIEALQSGIITRMYSTLRSISIGGNIVNRFRLTTVGALATTLVLAMWLFTYTRVVAAISPRFDAASTSFAVIASAASGNSQNTDEFGLHARVNISTTLHPLTGAQVIQDKELQDQIIEFLLEGTTAQDLSMNYGEVLTKTASNGIELSDSFLAANMNLPLLFQKEVMSEPKLTARYNPISNTIDVGTLAPERNVQHAVAALNRENAFTPIIVDEIKVNGESTTPSIDSNNNLVYVDQDGNPVVSYGSAVQLVSGVYLTPVVNLDPGALIMHIQIKSQGAKEIHPENLARVSTESGTLLQPMENGDFWAGLEDDEQESAYLVISGRLVPKDLPVRLVNDSLISDGNETPYATIDWKLKQVHFLGTAHPGNLRSDASVSSAKVGSIGNNAQVEILQRSVDRDNKAIPGKNEYWYKVKYPSSTDVGGNPSFTEAWIYGSLVDYYGDPELLPTEMYPKSDTEGSLLTATPAIQELAPNESIAVPDEWLLEKFDLNDPSQLEYSVSDQTGQTKPFMIRAYQNGELVIVAEHDREGQAWDWKDAALEGVPSPDNNLLSTIGLSNISMGKVERQGRAIAVINPENETAILAIPDGDAWRWGNEGIGYKVKRKTGIDFGFAVSYYSHDQVLGSAQGKEFVDFEATTITPESHMEARNFIQSLAYDDTTSTWKIALRTDRLDSIVSYSNETGKAIHLHPIIDTDEERLGRIADVANRDISRLEQDASLQPQLRTKYLALARQLINDIYSRYGETASRFTLINEARLRPNNIWRRLIGEDYLDQIFAIAQEISPDAQWIWNEWNRWDDEVQENSGQFFDAFASSVIDLRRKGVQIEHVGVQSHVSTRDWTDLYSAYFGFFDRMAKEGVAVHITELDWTEVHDIATQANQASAILRAATNINRKYDRQVVSDITVWGLLDDQSWLYRKGDPMRIDPLLLGEDGKPKNVYYEIIEQASKP